MFEENFTDEQRNVISKVEKLLRLAGKNPNEAEAAAAAAKAQELLALYNLDMASVSEANDPGARQEALLETGGRDYQRDLWAAVAGLNFCIHWMQQGYVMREKVVKVNGERRTRMTPTRVWQHKLVGRRVNVVATKVMAEYLEEAIERITRDRISVHQRTMLWSSWAVSFREGATEAVRSKIYERRREMMAEEQRKAEEARMAAMEAGRVSTSTALTLSTYTNAEYDANIDFVYGDGTSARWAAERAERARKVKEAEEAYTAWAKANPEAAAKAEKERLRESRQSSRSYRPMSNKAYRDQSARYQGYKAGEAISIDPQMDTGKQRRLN